MHHDDDSVYSERCTLTRHGHVYLVHPCLRPSPLKPRTVSIISRMQDPTYDNNALRSSEKHDHLTLLPDELLVRIIKLMQEPEEPPGPIWPPPLFPDFLLLSFQWMRIIFVCQRLYHVACCSPRLWNVIDTMANSQWKDICLSRAGSVPLALRARGITTSSADSTVVYEERVRTVLQILPRAYAIDLVVPFSPTLTDALCDPAPLLQHLTCRMRFTLTYKILGGCASALIVLELDGIDILSSPNFPVLQHLHLNNVRCLDNVDALLGLIGKAPMIEEVIIHGIVVLVRPRKNLQPSNQLVLDLPYLRNVNISDCAEIIRDVLRRLPDPLEDLSLRIQDRDLGYNTSWSIGDHSPHDQIFRRTFSFWRIRTGDEFPSGMTLHSYRNKSSRRFLHDLRIKSSRSLLGRCCSIDVDLDLPMTGNASVMEHVSCLRLNSFQYLDTDRAHDEHPWRALELRKKLGKPFDVVELDIRQIHLAEQVKTTLVDEGYAKWIKWGFDFEIESVQEQRYTQSR
jgi:hypothetical protein